MAGFYTDPWGSSSGSMLAGDTTYNGMGAYSGGASGGAASSSSLSGFGYASMFSSVISAIGSAQLQKTAAKSQQSSLEFQRDMAQINARMAERSAQSVLLQGQAAVGNLTLRAGRLKSAQRVALAANGVALDEGNAVEVQASTDLMKEVDMNTIEANAIRSAWGYRTQGVNAGNEALMAGASARSISPQQAGNTALMTGATSVAEKWLSYKQAGAI